MSSANELTESHQDHGTRQMENCFPGAITQLLRSVPRSIGIWILLETIKRAAHRKIF